MERPKNILLAKLASFALAINKPQQKTATAGPQCKNKFIGWPELMLVIDFRISNKRFGQ